MKRFSILLLALAAWALYCAWPPVVGGYLEAAPTVTVTPTRGEYVQALPTATGLPPTGTPEPTRTRVPYVREVRYEFVPTITATAEPTLVPRPSIEGWRQ